jgi:hypothetical protein
VRRWSGLLTEGRDLHRGDQLIFDNESRSPRLHLAGPPTSLTLPDTQQMCAEVPCGCATGGAPARRCCIASGIPAWSPGQQMLLRSWASQTTTAPRTTPDRTAQRGDRRDISQRGRRTAQRGSAARCGICPSYPRSGAEWTTGYPTSVLFTSAFTLWTSAARALSRTEARTRNESHHDEVQICRRSLGWNNPHIAA